MFSQKLKELRSQMGLTQKQLAQELEISQQAIARFELEKNSPTLSTIEKFADFFNVPITSFVSDDIHLEEVLNSNHIFYQQAPLSESQMIQVKEAIKDKIDKL